MIPNRSIEECAKAPAEARAQRERLAGLIRMSRKTAHNPADIHLCELVVAAAKENFEEYERLLRRREVNALFNKGALYFKPGR